jgi:hypothetical protein
MNPDYKDSWNMVKLEMNEQGTLGEIGIIYTENLGPCIGLCIAFGNWAGIIHSSHPPDDENEIRELIAKAKKNIPQEKICKIRPVICGSDPLCEWDDTDDYKNKRFAAREKIICILKDEGFDDPIAYWSKDTETAAVFANLETNQIIVEVDYKDYILPITNNA